MVIQEDLINDAVLGKFCVVRGSQFGVYVGTVKALDGTRVLLKDAQRVHFSRGEEALVYLAEKGIQPNYHDCAFPRIEKIILGNYIEIIPASEKAKESFRPV